MQCGELLTSCIVVWFGNQERKELQRVVRLTQQITATDLTSLQDLYERRVLKWYTVRMSSEIPPTPPTNYLSLSDLESGTRM